MGIHKWRFFSWAVTLLGAVLLVISYRSSGFRHGHWSALAVAGVVLILAGMVIHAVKFRCPSCGRHISDRTPLGTSHCPFCGASLEENHKDR